MFLSRLFGLSVFVNLNVFYSLSFLVQDSVFIQSLVDKCLSSSLFISVVLNLESSGCSRTCLLKHMYTALVWNRAAAMS